VHGFSLGMKQRLGIAAALLGDPPVLMFDEPVNGLDPEGIHWIRSLLKSLAGEGRTVFVSSHLMSEMALTADHLIVIGRGRLVADAPLSQFVQDGAPQQVVVRSPGAGRLAALLARHGAEVTTQAGGELAVSGVGAAEIGELASAHRITLHELSPRLATLEEAYMDLTRDSLDYRSALPAHSGKAA
jgi:ABC-2 type transport system ATP-binding protein